MERVRQQIAACYEADPSIRNILVTGAAGFIGSWVADHLARQYSRHYNIVGYDNMSKPATMNNLKHLFSWENFTLVKGDVCDFECLLQTMQSYHIDTVLHLAAQTCVDDSFDRPADSVTNNINGTYTLLECSRKIGIRRFIYMSTDEVYGPCGPENPATEDAPLRPTNPYSASKASGEMLVHSYYKSFGLPVAVIRSNNAYGPHQYPEKIVPKFCFHIKNNEKVTVMGRGLQSRCYLFVGDLVNALDTVLHKSKSWDFEVYNVASSEHLTTLEMSLAIVSAFEKAGEKSNEELINQWVCFIPDRPFHDMYYFTGCEKLESLGWCQQVFLKTGLEVTASWYNSVDSSWWN